MIEGHAACARLDSSRAGDLWVFNWLPGAYAHVDNLRPWLPKGITRPLGRRALCSLSDTMLDQLGVKDRYLHDAGDVPWLLVSDVFLADAARSLGCAMLGGWVRDGVTREAVALQHRHLDRQQYTTALHHASQRSALSFPDVPWPLPADECDCPLQLGASCMVAMLRGRADGAAQRLALRFAPGALVDLTLTPPQREDARALLIRVAANQALAPGWLDRQQWERSP